VACCGTGDEPQPPAQDAPVKKPETAQKAPTVAAASKQGGDKGDKEDEERINEDNHEELKATTEATGMDEGYRFWERNKTQKIKEARVPATNRQLTLQKTINATMKATLGGGELRHTVKLPEGEDLNEWIAVNTVHFYNAANMIYGTCVEFCTEASCPTMSAGRNEYLWKDGVKFKKPTRVPAPVYIDELLTWVNHQISDPALFPTDDGKFPPKFMGSVKNIYKRLFRLYAHIYWSHFEKIRSIGANAHLNTCFKHFVYFILEFNLVDKKGMAPLEKFIEKFKNADGV